MIINLPIYALTIYAGAITLHGLQHVVYKSGNITLHSQSLMIQQERNRNKKEYSKGISEIK
jgi:hypothetical protein